MDREQKTAEETRTIMDQEPYSGTGTADQNQGEAPETESETMRDVRDPGEAETFEEQGALPSEPKEGKGARRPSGKKVLCVEAGKVYDSIRDAASAAGVSLGIMRACLTGKRMGAVGYHWRFADEIGDSLEDTEENMETAQRKDEETVKTQEREKKAEGTERPATRSGARRVVCVEDGKVYPSVTEAAHAAGVQRTSMSMCLSGMRKSAGGLHWKYADAQEDILSDQPLKTPAKGSESAAESLKAGKRRGRSVLCVESGQTYVSIAAAAKAIGIGHTTISMVLSGKSKTAGGYHWAYADAVNEAEVSAAKSSPADQAGKDAEKEAEKEAAPDAFDLATAQGIEARIAANNEKLRALRAACDALNAENEELSHRLEQLNDKKKAHELFEQALAGGMSVDEIRKRLGL